MPNSRVTRNESDGRGKASSEYEEGGWGLVILAAAFVSEFVIFGNLKALGVIVTHVSQHFDTEIWLTGWMVSLSFASQWLLGPLVPPLMRVFGHRPVMLLCATMVTAGYIVAAFAKTFAVWSFAIIVLSGLGSGFFIYPLLSLLATYFKKYYPLTSVISSLGMSLGTLVMGPLAQLLLDTYGWRSTMMLMSALSFHLVPVAAVALPSVASRRNRQSPYESVSQDGQPDDHSATDGPSAKGRCSQCLAAFDVAIFRDVHFVTVTLAGGIIAFVFVGWAVFVVPHGINQGLSEAQASFLPTAFGLGNACGKVTVILLVQSGLVGNRWVLVAGSLLASVSFGMDPFLASYHGLLLTSLAIGIGNGSCTAAKVNLFREITTTDRVLAVFCWQGILLGVCQIVAGFASGWFFEVTGSFITTFIMFALVQFLAVVVMLIDIVIVRLQQDRDTTKD